MRTLCIKILHGEALQIFRALLFSWGQSIYRKSVAQIPSGTCTQTNIQRLALDKIYTDTGCIKKHSRSNYFLSIEHPIYSSGMRITRNVSG